MAANPVTNITFPLDTKRPTAPPKPEDLNMGGARGYYVYPFHKRDLKLSLFEFLFQRGFGGDDVGRRGGVPVDHVAGWLRPKIPPRKYGFGQREMSIMIKDLHKLVYGKPLTSIVVPRFYMTAMGGQAWGSAEINKSWTTQKEIWNHIDLLLRIPQVKLDRISETHLFNYDLTVKRSYKPTKVFFLARRPGVNKVAGQPHLSPRQAKIARVIDHFRLEELKPAAKILKQHDRRVRRKARRAARTLAHAGQLSLELDRLRRFMSTMAERAQKVHRMPSNKTNELLAARDTVHKLENLTAELRKEASAGKIVSKTLRETYLRWFIDDAAELSWTRRLITKDDRVAFLPQYKSLLDKIGRYLVGIIRVLMVDSRMAPKLYKGLQKALEQNRSGKKYALPANASAVANLLAVLDHMPKRKYIPAGIQALARTAIQMVAAYAIGHKKALSQDVGLAGLRLGFGLSQEQIGTIAGKATWRKRFETSETWVTKIMFAGGSKKFEHMLFGASRNWSREGPAVKLGNNVKAAMGTTFLLSLAETIADPSARSWVQLASETSYVSDRLLARFGVSDVGKIANGLKGVQGVFGVISGGWSLYDGIDKGNDVDIAAGAMGIMSTGVWLLGMANPATGWMFLAISVVLEVVKTITPEEDHGPSSIMKEVFPQIPFQLQRVMSKIIIALHGKNSTQYRNAEQLWRPVRHALRAETAPYEAMDPKGGADGHTTIIKAIVNCGYSEKQAVNFVVGLK